MAEINRDNKEKWLTIPALGVVFGDIGTSPLYTLRECLNASGPDLAEPVVLGVLSLIFWTILMVVTLKYVWFVMRADNHGEGGILALLALALRSAGQNPRTRWLLMTCGLFGAALFYGDGMITPAISVLSAVEGLEIALPAFKSYVIPMAVAVLIALFAVQHRGTASSGRYFGPVMLLWFLILGATGLVHVMAQPRVLSAFNPVHAIDFVMIHGYGALVVLGAVVLAVTGAEALYADMGHFGARPIRAAWFYLVLPALVLNYFGQGALVLMTPEAAKNPFFHMFPAWAQLPMVGLATTATIIASQAVISGAYSLTQQAFQLGYLPRMEVVHTSAAERGQIYLPGVNWLLLLAIIGLVLGFRSSSRLASAYGIAVTGTMLMTTVLLSVVARRYWQWNIVYTVLLVGVFLIIDGLFFGANLLKVVEGGWIPLAVGIGVYTVMATWRKGREILRKKLYRQRCFLEDFLATAAKNIPQRVPGTAVFLAPPDENVPHALLDNIKHNKILHARVIVLSILVTDRPRVARKERYTLRPLDQGFYQITAQYGFMEMPDVPKLLSQCRPLGLEVDLSDTSFFLSRLRVIPTRNPGMAFWRQRLFAVMLKNAAHATDFYRIPNSRVMELDRRLEI